MTELNFESMFTDSKKEYAPIPAGEHQCQFTKLQLHMNKEITKKDGSKMTLDPHIEIGLKITSPEAENRVIFDQIKLTGNAAWKVGAFFKALNLTKAGSVDEIEKALELASNMLCEIKLSYREYNGKQYSNVEYIRGWSDDVPF